MKRIWTIGHSTREIESFIEILNSFNIKILADVRSYPGSSRYPHFNKERLPEYLKEKGISYEHISELGGRRKPVPDSKNTVWKNPGFRGFADYMSSEKFLNGVNHLTALAGKINTVYMCAEAVWWRCHRSLISDYLKFQGWEVIHIFDKDKSEEHPYTRQARIRQNDLFYDG
jgi:uncharacterized protein (DUF488 family)